MQWQQYIAISISLIELTIAISINRLKRKKNDNSSKKEEKKKERWKSNNSHAR